VQATSLSLTIAASHPLSPSPVPLLTWQGTRAESLRNNDRQREAQEKTRAHMQAFVDRFRSNASRASMVQSRIKALGRMECVAQKRETTPSDPTLPCLPPLLSSPPRAATWPPLPSPPHHPVLLPRGRCVAEILEDPSLRFGFPSPEPLSAPVLQVSAQRLPPSNNLVLSTLLIPC
jgi:hypothetical protein